MTCLTNRVHGVEAFPFSLFALPFAFMPLVAVIAEPNSPVELREVPLPDLENDSALFEVELSEVCV